jgi:hypothetical protein
MDTIILNEKSQSHKEKYHMFSLIYGMQVAKDMKANRGLLEMW